MNTLRRVLLHQVRDVMRGRAIAGYTLFFALSTWGLLHFGGGAGRALPSLATLVVLVVPLVCLLITTTYAYHGADFIELLLSQPVGRRPLFAGLWLGLTLPLVGAFLHDQGIHGRSSVGDRSAHGAFGRQQLRQNGRRRRRGAE